MNESPCFACGHLHDPNSSGDCAAATCLPECPKHYQPRRRTSAYELIIQPLPEDDRNLLLNLMVTVCSHSVEGSFPKSDGTVSVRFRCGDDIAAENEAASMLADAPGREALLLVGLGGNARLIREFAA